MADTASTREVAGQTLAELGSRVPRPRRPGGRPQRLHLRLPVRRKVPRPILRLRPRRAEHRQRRRRHGLLGQNPRRQHLRRLLHQPAPRPASRRRVPAPPQRQGHRHPQRHHHRRRRRVRPQHRGPGAHVRAARVHRGRARRRPGGRPRRPQRRRHAGPVLRPAVPRGHAGGARRRTTTSGWARPRRCARAATPR